jgi:hypothetical protein
MRTKDLQPGTAYLYRENDRGPGQMVYVVDNTPWRQLPRGWSQTDPSPRVLSLTDDGSGAQVKGTPVLTIDKLTHEHAVPEAELAHTAAELREVLAANGSYTIPLRRMGATTTYIETPESICEVDGRRAPVWVRLINPRWIVGPWDEYVERNRLHAEQLDKFTAEQNERTRAQADRIGQIQALGRWANVDLSIDVLSSFDDKIIVNSADLLRVLHALYLADSDAGTAADRARAAASKDEH